jgi:hypothetical protein
MILNTLFSWFVSLLGALLDLIPSFGLPDAAVATAAVSDARVWEYVGWANHYVPVDLAAALLAVRVTLWAALHGLDAVVWVLTKLHILGGSS